MTDIKAAELKNKLEAGETVTLVDVRSAHAYQEKHIPGAVNVPVEVDGFDVLAAKAMPDKDAVLVLYADHEKDGLATRATQTLEKLGYTKAVHLVGGLMGWMESGGTVEFGRES